MASLFPTISNALDRVIPGADSKQVASKMEEQSSALKNITKVLIKNNEDLKKDVGDLKKEFILGTSEFSRMRQYFERMDNAKPAEKVKERENQSNSPGILQRLISSLTRRVSPNEPREIELKNLEELRIIKSLTTKTANDIEFIRGSFSESEKKKDRELLAIAIAQKLDIESNSQSMLGTLATSLAVLGGSLISAFKLGFSGIKTVLSGLPEMIKLVTSVFSKIPGLLVGLTSLLSGLKAILGGLAIGLAQVLRIIPNPAAKAAGLALGGVGASLLLGEGASAEETVPKKEPEVVPQPRDKSKEGFFEGLWKDTEDWIAKGKKEDAEREARDNQQRAQLKPAVPQTDPGDMGSLQANQQLSLNQDRKDDILETTIDAVKDQTQILKDRIMSQSGMFDADDIFKNITESPLGKFALDKIKGLGELEFDDGKMNVFSGLPSVISQLYDKGMKETQEFRDAIEETIKGNPPVNVSSSTVVTGGTNQQIAFSDATPMSQSDSFRNWLSNNGVLRGGN